MLMLYWRLIQARRERKSQKDIELVYHYDDAPHSMSNTHNIYSSPSELNKTERTGTELKGIGRVYKYVQTGITKHIP